MRQRVRSVTIVYEPDGDEETYTERIVCERVTTHNSPPRMTPAKANIEYLEIRINLGDDSRA